jgi:hypothetical protein
MARGWMVSLGLSGLVLAAALVVNAWPPASRSAAQTDLDASSDPCFSYGRFECCVRP